MRLWRLEAILHEKCVIEAHSRENDRQTERKKESERTFIRIYGLLFSILSGSDHNLLGNNGAGYRGGGGLLCQVRSATVRI